MPRNVTRAALFLLATLAAVVVAACGGSDDASSETSAKQQLASVRPLSSAQVSVAARILFDNAPPSVGDKLELTFDGPLRNNGSDKLPSLDWKVAFSGLTTKFTSRIVSTGDNFFINLGGQDFEAGREAVGQIVEQARSSKQKGVVGFDPLAAVDGVKKAGAVTVAGAKATRYTGAIDLDGVMDQYERLSRTLPTQGAAAAVPQGKLTPAQRAQVKRTFGHPRFEAAVAGDDTIRRLVVTTRFTTPAANKDAAGGITGGRMEYRVEYSDVGKAVTITPPTDTQPIGDFARELQRILAQRG
ncbi:MAG: hypothetical protein M3P44_10985 [Actinomycetota bacterium]|nr:hypothetical protein [Actinomycetota bacterium]